MGAGVGGGVGGAVFLHTALHAACVCAPLPSSHCPVVGLQPNVASGVGDGVGGLVGGGVGGAVGGGVGGGVGPGVGQVWVSHAWEADPLQGRPPWDGAGLVQVRVCVPPPQVAEQVPQPDQPPSTGQAWGLQVSEPDPAQE